MPLRVFHKINKPPGDGKPTIDIADDTDRKFPFLFRGADALQSRSPLRRSGMQGIEKAREHTLFVGCTAGDHG
jgi:hypothetical protein